MKIKVVSTENDFNELKDDWVRLVEMNSELSVFQDWEWQRLWWKNYGDNKSLKIIVAYSNDQVIGILPLYIQRQKLMRFANVNVMRFIGTGGDTSPDYLGLITQDNHNEELLELFVDAVLDMKMEWDSLNMTNMGTCDGVVTRLADRCKEENLSNLLIVDAHIPIINLSNNWDDYLSELSSNRRAQIRRSRRKFEEQPGSKFYIWENGENLSFAVDKLIELHHKRWQGRSDSYAFSSSEYVSFHREIIQKLFARDLIRLCCLQVEGKIIAMLYCYKWNQKYYYFQSGIDPDYAHLKPGAVLMSYCIEHAIKEGAGIFDMLKGDYSFKRSLAKQENTTWRFAAYNNSLRGNLMWMRKEKLPTFKTKLKSLVR